MALAGAAISAYLVAAHAEKVPLVCSATSVINCASVTRSAYSVIPRTNIPISVLGVAWFLGSGAVSVTALAAVTIGRPEPRWVRPLHFGWASLGLAVVLYLVFVEVVLLHQLCEWCTAVHVLVIATFLLTLHRLQQLTAGD
jgi:uncharacterized membrane protein